MLARLVVVRPAYTMRYRYVEVVQGETHEAVNEALLELITRPGIKWLEPLTLTSKPEQLGSGPGWD